MEFTYDGLVRYGFGFYNPNHAAAFVCALLPYVWLLLLQSAIWKKLLGAVLTAALTVALAFTYSRAGLLVFSLEAIAFVAFCGRKYWEWFLGVGVMLMLAIFIANGFGRLSFDAAASNRLDIWKAGLALFAANPTGVGLGNSGEIVSAFFLPDGVNCRTLINSHLSLFCEFGFIVGSLWVSIIFCAIKGGLCANNSNLKFAALVSFCGLLISSSLSSVFDWEAMLNPTKFEYLTGANIAASYAIFAMFCLLAAFLLKASFNLKLFLCVFILCLMAFSPFFIISRGSVLLPAVRNCNGDIFIRNCSDPPYSVVIFDDNYTLKGALKILKKHGLDERICICKNSWQNKEELPRQNPKRFILFGNCADFINPESAPNILIAPPPHFKTGAKNISKIYIRQFDSRYDEMKTWAKESNVKILWL